MNKKMHKVAAIFGILLVLCISVLPAFADDSTTINNGLQYKTSILDFDSCFVSYGGDMLYMGSPLRWPTGASSLSPNLNQTEEHIIAGNSWEFDRYYNTVNNDFWFKGTTSSNHVVITLMSENTAIYYYDFDKLIDSLYIMVPSLASTSCTVTMSGTIATGSISRDYDYYSDGLTGADGFLGFSSTAAKFSFSFSPTKSNNRYSVIKQDFVNLLENAFTINWFRRGIFYRSEPGFGAAPGHYLRVSNLVLKIDLVNNSTNGVDWEWNLHSPPGGGRDSYDLQLAHFYSEGCGLNISLPASMDTEGYFAALAPLFQSVGAFFDLRLFGDFTLGHVGLICIGIAMFGVIKYFMHIG